MTYENIPGPRARFLSIKELRKFQSDPVNYLLHTGHTYGDIAFTHLGHIKWFLINSPECMKIIMEDHHGEISKVTQHRKIFEQVDGKALFTTEGNEWENQRKNLGKAFNADNFKHLFENVHNEVDQLVIQEDVEINLSKEMTQLAAKIILKTILGVEEVNPNTIKLLSDLSSELYADFLSPVLAPKWWPSKRNRKKHQVIGELKQFIAKVIAERKNSKIQRNDLLGILLKLPQDNLNDQIMTFHNASFDTTSAALEWTWYLLGRHPEYQVRIREEFRSSLQDGELKFGDLRKLTVVENVIKESLRLYPPAIVLAARQANKKINLGKYTIPKGSWMYLSPLVTGRDSRYFERADEFVPERFNDPIDDYTFFPFGLGPHKCIGMHFALNEMKMIISLILSKYEFKISDNTEPGFDLKLTLKPARSIRGTFKRVVNS